MTDPRLPGEIRRYWLYDGARGWWQFAPSSAAIQQREKHLIRIATQSKTRLFSDDGWTAWRPVRGDVVDMLHSAWLAGLVTFYDNEQRGGGDKNPRPRVLVVLEAFSIFFTFRRVRDCLSYGGANRLCDQPKLREIPYHDLTDPWRAAIGGQLVYGEFPQAERAATPAEEGE